MTPFLQLLLNRKKNDTQTYGPWSERLPDGSSSIAPPLMSERGGSPTIPLRTPPNTPAPPATIPLGTTNQPTTTPVVPAAAPVDPYAARIEADRQRVLEAQNRPHSRVKAIGEGLADWAASGVGIPLRRIMHPQGSETDQANRQLATDIALQKQAGDIQEQQAGISLRRRQAEKIQSELDNPEQPKSGPGFTLGEGQVRYDAQGNVIATRPGKTTEKLPERNVINGVLVEKQADGTWKPVYTAPEKPVKPGKTTSYGILEKGFRDNAAKAQAAAEKAEQDAKDYIAGKVAVNSAFDPEKDANVAALTAESRRQRAFAAKQIEKADEAAMKKSAEGEQEPPTSGVGMVPGVSAARKLKTKGTKPAPTTHDFSIRAYQQRNKGASEADARAFAAANYPGYAIVP